MTKEEVFNFFYTNSANLGVMRIGIILVAGLIISAVICLIYFATSRGGNL